MEQLRHRAALRTAYVQRRFVIALTLVGGVFLSLLRQEVPLWGGGAALAPLTWAALENRRMERLSREEYLEARLLLEAFEKLADEAEGLSSQGRD